MITLILILTFVFIMLLILGAYCESNKNKKFYKDLNQAYRESLDRESKYNLKN